MKKTINQKQLENMIAECVGQVLAESRQPRQQKPARKVMNEAQLERYIQNIINEELENEGPLDFVKGMGGFFGRKTKDAADATGKKIGQTMDKVGGAIKGTADKVGGAIFWNGSYGLISNCYFVNNSAYKGGAINWNGENGVISHSSFVNNSAYKGGAINWDEDDGCVKYSYFANNSAYKGGAIYWDEPTGIISHCYFVNNSAYKGGAIYLEDGKIKIIDCHFHNNHNDDVYLKDNDDDDDDDTENSINFMENAGNPIILLIISLLSIFCISFKFK